MSKQIECPVCKSKLKTFTMRHINSKKHQDALKESGIESSQDPALKFLPSEPEKKKDVDKKEEKKKELNYSSKEDMDLGIPEVPMPPKQKLTLESPGLSINVLEHMEEVDTDNVKVVLANCQRCKEIIPIPVTISLIKNSKLPVVPIIYVHKNTRNEDLHCLILFLDHDFDIRRQRISDVIISKKLNL